MRFDQHKGIYKEAYGYLNKNNDVHAIITTGEPFVLFKHGYRIKKKFGVTIYKEKNLDTFNNIVQLTNFINTCDFVISVSNTNAHLSAYLGKPTLLLLPKTRGKFWYWENEINGTNLWYPSIIKFKQNIIGEWSHPINNLKKYLSENYV